MLLNSFPFVHYNAKDLETRWSRGSVSFQSQSQTLALPGEGKMLSLVGGGKPYLL